MSATYIIRRGEVRRAGDYCGGCWSDDQRDAFRFTHREVQRYMAGMVGGDYRAVRLLPAGTMRARRKATARELRAHAKRLRARGVDAGRLRSLLEEDARDEVAAELEARAAELEAAK